MCALLVSVSACIPTACTDYYYSGIVFNTNNSQYVDIIIRATTSVSEMEHLTREQDYHGYYFYNSNIIRMKIKSECLSCSEDMIHAENETEVLEQLDSSWVM